MASSIAGKVLVSDSLTAFKLLNGVVCLYKPAGWHYEKLNKEIRNKLCEDLNLMEPLPRKEIVQVRRVDGNDVNEERTPLDNEQIVASIEDGSKKVEVIKGLGFADHHLVTGPRYRHEDVKLMSTYKTTKEVSGLHVFGVNKGVFKANQIIHSRWLRTYLVSGRFGIATDDCFHTGKIIEKATYGRIRKIGLDNLLAAIQSSHQRLSFMSSGAPIDSDRAYELASQGLVRPAAKTATILYSLTTKEFKLPDFTIEIKAINEDGDYLKEVVHDIGLKLHSVATCTRMHCTNVGPFGLQDALLLKHWNVQNFIDNMQKNKEIMSEFNNEERQHWVGDGTGVTES